MATEIRIRLHPAVGWRDKVVLSVEFWLRSDSRLAASIVGSVNFDVTQLLNQQRKKT